MKFWYMVRDSVPHTGTVGICEIIFTEREKELHQDSTSGGFNPFSVSLTFGNSIRAVRGKNWRNLREPLEMLLSLSEDTWARLEVRDELFTIGDQLEWIFGCFRNFHFILIIIIVNYICLTDQLLCYCVEREPYKSGTFSN